MQEKRGVGLAPRIGEIVNVVGELETVRRREGMIHCSTVLGKVGEWAKLGSILEDFYLTQINAILSSSRVYEYTPQYCRRESGQQRKTASLPARDSAASWRRPRLSARRVPEVLQWTPGTRVSEQITVSAADRADRAW